MLNPFSTHIVYDADGGGNGGGVTPPPAPAAGIPGANAGRPPNADGAPPATPPESETPPEPLQFGAWITKQPEPVKELVTGHIQNLKSALDSERDQRKTLAAQLREATEKAEKGSEMRQSLEKISGELESATRLAEFYEQAAAPNVGVKNLKLAWVVAEKDGMLKEFVRYNKVDYAALFTHMKEQYPELFAKPVQPAPPANIGNGAGQQGRGKPFDMNDLLREQAGIRRR